MQYRMKLKLKLMAWNELSTAWLKLNLAVIDESSITILLRKLRISAGETSRMYMITMTTKVNVILWVESIEGVLAVWY